MRKSNIILYEVYLSYITIKKTNIIGNFTHLLNIQTYDIIMFNKTIS